MSSRRVPSVWSHLHASLSRKVRSLAADRFWAEARQCFPSLAPYSSASELIFTRAISKRPTDQELDEGYATLRALIAIYQGKTSLPTVRRADEFSAPHEVDTVEEAPPLSVWQWSATARDFALSTLWLCLWPGLDLIRAKRTPMYSSPEECISSITDHLLRIVGATNVDASPRVAGNVVRSVARDMRRELHHQWVAFDLSEEGVLDEYEQPGCRSASDLPLPNYSLERHVIRLTEEIRPIVGDDAALIVAVHALGEAQDEAGARLGIPEHGARKRVQRGMAKLRESLRPCA